MLFVKIDYPKNADGKRESFITPEYLDINMSLKNNSFFSFDGPIFFELRVPTI